MSMLSERLCPSACEVDVMGAVAMLSLALASGRPSALVDWNNNYGDDPDRCVLFHCSNFPRSLVEDPKMSGQDILAATVGYENSWGTCVGKIRPGPMTFARLSTDDTVGEIVGYVGEGEFTTDPDDSFGGYGVAHVDDLQRLLQHICRMGFEHHVAVNPTRVAAAVHEAWSNYLDWSVYYHE
jgi:L-fucose isomerase-like protein